VILNIPLSSVMPPDRLIWQGTKDGIFSVRSAYHRRVELQEASRGQCSYKDISSDVWKIIWSLQIKNPVKVFLWRACKNLLPTKLNLHHKKVVKDSLCPCCGLEPEDTIHALWSCPAARCVEWLKIGISEMLFWWQFCLATRKIFYRKAEEGPNRVNGCGRGVQAVRLITAINR